LETAGDHGKKAHFAALDGLRGFAALAVVFFHLGHWLNVPWLAANSDLAVDLFFCLSGYVIPYAYLRRSKQLSTGRFFQIRLVRLMPLIFLGLLISATYVVLRSSRAGGHVPAFDIALAFVLGCLNLPYFGAPKLIGGPELFPLNGPQFSIFFELFINAFWWMTRGIHQLRLSLALAVLSFVLIVIFGLGGDLPGNFWFGFPRVGASFFAGVAIFNLAGQIPRLRGESLIFWFATAMMVLLFFWPAELPLSAQLLWIAIISPLLVFTGSRIAFGKTFSQCCTLGGALSYPIYCLHYPIFEWINGLYRERFGPQDIAIEGPVVVIGALCLGYVILKLYDERVRRFLTVR